MAISRQGAHTLFPKYYNTTVPCRSVLKARKFDRSSAATRKKCVTWKRIRFGLRCQPQLEPQPHDQYWYAISLESLRQVPSGRHISSPGMVFQQSPYLCYDHVQCYHIEPALGDDHISVTLTGLYEFQVHGPHCTLVLLNHRA